MLAKTGLATIALLLPLAACTGSKSNAGPERHFPLTGKIVALDAKHQVASIDAAAIPNFMDAMTMEYPIAKKADFEKLHVGDRITATLNVTASGDEYNVTDIHKQNAGK